MKGSIRFFLGFLLTLGAVGGFEVATDIQTEMMQITLAIFGLVSMYSGARALNENS